MEKERFDDLPRSLIAIGSHRGALRLVAGAECCGGGGCAPGRCTTVNGQTCCQKVIDNRPYCPRM